MCARTSPALRRATTTFPIRAQRAPQCRRVHVHAPLTARRARARIWGRSSARRRHRRRGRAGWGSPRVTEVRHYTPATSTSPSSVETYAYNALGGFSIYDGAVVDDQRPRISGTGKASAGVPATFGGQPVTLDGGGRITALGSSTFQYYNFHHHLESIASGFVTQTFAYDALERIETIKYRSPGGTQQDAAWIYGDLSNSVTAQASAPINPTVPPQIPYIPDTDFRVGYDGIDHPLWLDHGGGYVEYPELDTIGNVRRVHAGASASDPTFKGDQGGLSYSAFGKTYTSTITTSTPFGWQGHQQLGSLNLYDFRARIWSSDLGSFLQPDEYVFLGHTGTLWSWPGQNPFRWRDPSGRDASDWFMRNAESMQDGALAVSSLALTVATFGAALEVGAALESGNLTLGLAARSAAVGALKGAGIGAAVDVGKQLLKDCPNGISGREVAEAAAAGAVSGAIFGARGGIGAAVATRGVDIVGQAEHAGLQPTQLEVNPGIVARYAAKLEAGEAVDPIHAVEVPDGRQFIIEGHHRYVASQLTGIPVPTVVTQGAGPVGFNWGQVSYSDFIPE